MPFSANSCDYDINDFITSGAERWTVPPPSILPEAAVTGVALQEPGQLVEGANMYDLDFNITGNHLEQTESDVKPTKVGLLEPVTERAQAQLQTNSNTTSFHPWATLRSWRNVQRHAYTNPASAAVRSMTFLNLDDFKTSVSYRNVRDIHYANPKMPVCLLGCGWMQDKESGKDVKKLANSHFWATPSYLEGVHFLDLVKMVETMHPGECNHCTMVLEDKPAHVYFDFDASSDSEHPEKDMMFRKVEGREGDVQLEWRRLFVLYFQQVYGRAPNLSGLHWESASTKGKFSLHAHLITEAFVNIDQQKNFVAGFVEFIKSQPETEVGGSESFLFVRQYEMTHDQQRAREYTLLMDASVYTKNRNFRLVNCCKPGKEPLRWIADPGMHISIDQQKSPSLKELLFRGLISYSIDVDADQLLQCDPVSSPTCASAVQCPASSRQPANVTKAAAALMPTRPDSKVPLSAMSISMLQCILRSDNLLGAAAEIDACYVTTYSNSRRSRTTVCIVGHCKAKTAACMSKSDRSVQPARMYYHDSAVTNFVVTAEAVQIWDWACGKGAPGANRVSLLPAQRHFLQGLLVGVGAPTIVVEAMEGTEAAVLSDSEVESDDDMSSSSSASTVASIQDDGCIRAEGQPSRPNNAPTPRPLAGIEIICDQSLAQPVNVVAVVPRVAPKKRKAVSANIHEANDLLVAPGPAQDAPAVLPHALEFDPWGLHTVDCHSIRDTRPKQSTIEQIVRKWEESSDVRRQVKRAKRKFGGRDQKQELAARMQDLQQQVLTDIVLYLNQYFKVSTRISEPLVTVTLIEESAAGKRREWQSDYFAVKAFLISYSYLNVSLQGRSLKVAQMWLDHPQCARFDKIIFQPAPDGQVIPRESMSSCNHNLWTGFQISAFDSARFMRSMTINAAKQALKPLLHHIWSIWCRGNQTLYEYTMNWMAWCVQKPNEKTSAAIVIRGDKGSGKGIVMDVLGKIFGPKHFYHAQRAEQLLGDFNDHLQSCLLCFVDEVTFADDVKATNMLKGMVTESKVTIHAKFKSRMFIDSYMNLVLAGNMAKLIECEGNERRYFVLETDNKWSGQQTQATSDYFAQIRAVPPELLRAFLSGRDIRRFNPRKVPDTPAMRDQKALSLAPLNRWWHECLVRGYVAQTMHGDATSAAVVQEGVSEAELMEHTWQRPLQKDIIHRSYVQWCKEVSTRKNEDTSSTFWKSMHTLLRPKDQGSLLVFKRPVCKKTESAAPGTSSESRVQREHVVQLPPLKVCRELFSQTVVHDSDWCFDQEGETSFGQRPRPSTATDENLGLSALQHRPFVLQCVDSNPILLTK